MIYDALIRHSRRVPYGEGFEHSLELRHVNARSEEEAYLKIEQTPLDAIACIDSWHHQGVVPFSVETGDPDFFAEVHRPALVLGGMEPRVG